MSTPDKGIIGIGVLIWMAAGVAAWLGILGIEGHLHGHQNCVCVGKANLDGYCQIQVALGPLDVPKSLKNEPR